MTNEEIKKRFQFDLKIGVFKKTIEYEVDFIIRKENLYFLDFLIDNGYFYDNRIPDIKTQILNLSEDDDICITINEGTKEIYPSVLYSLKSVGIFHSEYFNEIPDYIKEYKLNDE